jgi:hypothetical protein
MARPTYFLTCIYSRMSVPNSVSGQSDVERIILAEQSRRQMPPPKFSLRYLSTSTSKVGRLLKWRGVAVPNTSPWLQDLKRVWIIALVGLLTTFKEEFSTFASSQSRSASTLCFLRSLAGYGYSLNHLHTSLSIVSLTWARWMSWYLLFEIIAPAQGSLSYQDVVFRGGFGLNTSAYSGYPNEENNEAWKKLYNCESWGVASNVLRW